MDHIHKSFQKIGVTCNKVIIDYCRPHPYILAPIECTNWGFDRDCSQIPLGKTLCQTRKFDLVVELFFQIFEIIAANSGNKINKIKSFKNCNCLGFFEILSQSGVTIQNLT